MRSTASTTSYASTNVPPDLTIPLFSKIIEDHATILEEKVSQIKAISPFDVVRVQTETADTLYAKYGYTENIIMAAINKYKDCPQFGVKDNITRLNNITKSLMTPPEQ